MHSSHQHDFYKTVVKDSYKSFVCEGKRNNFKRHRSEFVHANFLQDLTAEDFFGKGPFCYYQQPTINRDQPQKQKFINAHMMLLTVQ